MAEASAKKIEEPEWLEEIPLSERRVGIGSLLYALTPLIFSALALYKPSPLLGIYQAPICAIPGVWMLWQWYLRKYRPEIAFKTWEQDELVMKRIFRMELVLQSAAMIWLVGFVLLLSFKIRLSEVNLLLYPLLLANPAMRDYYRDHRPRVKKNYEGWNEASLEPLQSEHWGEAPVSRG